MSMSSFGLTVEAVHEDWSNAAADYVTLDPPHWKVFLPHQCDSWRIDAADSYEDATTHTEAVLRLAAFVLEARAALGALMEHRPYGNDVTEPTEENRRSTTAKPTKGVPVSTDPRCTCIQPWWSERQYHDISCVLRASSSSASTDQEGAATCDCEPEVFADNSVLHDDRCAIYPWCPHEAGAFSCGMPCGCSCKSCSMLAKAHALDVASRPAVVADPTPLRPSALKGSAARSASPETEGAAPCTRTDNHHHHGAWVCFLCDGSAPRVPCPVGSEPDPFVFGGRRSASPVLVSVPASLLDALLDAVPPVTVGQRASEDYALLAAARRALIDWRSGGLS